MHHHLTNNTNPAQYSRYGHIQKLAEAEAAGIRAAGGSCDLFRVPETIAHRGALPAKPSTGPDPGTEGSSIQTLDSPTTLEDYDGYLFGVPTRYGNMPAQWKTFWDGTGGQWAQASYKGKFAGLFVSTGTQGGGQESTCVAMMSTLAHHGIIYVPLGYGEAFPLLADLSEVRGGSPWGAGTFAVSQQSRSNCVGLALA